MAQTGFTPISIYYSATATNVPTAGNLVAGELAINTADGKLFYKDSSGVVQTIASKAGALGDVVGPASATDNAVSRFDLTTGKLIQNSLVTISDTGAISAPVDASISGLTVGKGGGAIATNTAIGAAALTSNSTGANSVAIGYTALQTNSTGLRNIAIGSGALATSSTASDNLAIGYVAGTSLTTGTYNSFVGGYGGVSFSSGQANTTGSNNSGFGGGSLGSNTTGNSNTGLGHLALYSNTTASNNTAVGYQALYGNSTGIRNTAIGVGAAYSTTGNGINAFGYYALYNNSTGNSNTAIGGSYNTSAALQTNTTGSFNVAVGEGSLSLNTTASNNTAVGYQAGYANTTGANNFFGGYLAGSTITTGSNNIYVGANSIASSATAGGEIVIGAASSTGKGSNTGFINPNTGGVYQGNNSATWSITSDERLKKNIVDNATGLSAITAIQVRNFEYRTKDEVTELPSQNAIEITGVQLGAIAQELQAILPDCVKTESTGVMSVDTTNLTWYLINAVKELKAEIDLLKGK
jgi:hypothetical protein